MARTPTMVMQTIWDCRWSRPGYVPDVGFVPDGLTVPAEPRALWVCVRPTGTTVRRPVTEEECQACPHWQAAFAELDD